MARAQLLLAAALLALALTAAGCGGAKSQLLIKKGMTASEVRSTAGRPYRKGALNLDESRCWFYRASKKGPAEEVIACFFRDRVNYVHYGWPL